MDSYCEDLKFESSRALLENFQADFPPSLTALKTCQQCFVTSQGWVAYRKKGRQWIVYGEPVTRSGCYEDKVELLEAFYRFARKNGSYVCGYYVSEGLDSPLFRKMQMGSSFLIKMDDFIVDAPNSKNVRRALGFGQRQGYRIVEVLPAFKKAWEQEIKDLHYHWLGQKKGPEVRFFLSKPEANHCLFEKERWFAVTREKRLVAFLSLVPYQTQEGVGYYLDHMVRHKEGRLAIDFGISSILKTLKKEGAQELSLGLNPFRISKPDHLMERLFHWHFHWGGWYSAQGLYQFKKKFGGYEVPRFILFNRDQNVWQQLWQMGAVTFAWPRSFGWLLAEAKEPEPVTPPVHV